MAPTETDFDVSNVRTQLIKTVQVMGKPSRLLIALFARTHIQAHGDHIASLQTEKALIEKQIVEVFTELLALDGRPVATGRENTPDFFTFIEGEAEVIKAEISHMEEQS